MTKSLIEQSSNVAKVILEEQPSHPKWLASDQKRLTTEIVKEKLTLQSKKLDENKGDKNLP